MLLPFVFRATLIGLPRSNLARLASGRNAQNQPAPDSPGVPQIQPCEACSGRNAQNTPKTSPPQTARGASNPTLRGLRREVCTASPHRGQLSEPTKWASLPEWGRKRRANRAANAAGGFEAYRTVRRRAEVFGLYEGGRKYSDCTKAGGSIRNALRKIVRIPCTEPAFGVECRSYLEERSDRITKDGRKRGTYEEDISCDRHAE